MFCKAVAGKIIKFCFIAGTDNIANIMTKFLPYPVFWPFVEPVLFWKGETDSGEKTSKQTWGECQDYF